MCLLQRVPDHILPATYFSILPFEEVGDKQASIITMSSPILFSTSPQLNEGICRFSIWNTMLGTALLSMPWALQQAGFVLGLLILIVMAAIAFYTAYRVVESPQGLSWLQSPVPFFCNRRLVTRPGGRGRVLGRVPLLLGQAGRGGGRGLLHGRPPGLRHRLLGPHVQLPLLHWPRHLR